VTEALRATKGVRLAAIKDAVVRLSS
jgi:hypothetical protein